MALAAIDLNALTTALDVSESSSRKWVVYTTDSGEQYSVFKDELQAEVLGFDDVTASLNPPPLPKGFKMRAVNVRDTSGKVKQTFEVGKVGEDIYQEGGSITIPRKGNATGLALYVTGTRGEKKRLVLASDTGQSGGDPT